LSLITRIKNAIYAFRETTFNVDKDDEDWSRLTGDSSRDLAPFLHERSQQIAYYLFERNPMAKRMIEMTVQYIISEGVHIKAEDKELQDFIDDFWKINDLTNRLEEYSKELGLWGEQCYQTFTNTVNGRTRLGYHDPGTIKEVVRTPGNVLQLQKIVLHGNPERTLAPVIHLDVMQDGSEYAGDTFFFKINSVIKASRGRSDLFAGADFFDLTSQFVFSRGERSMFGNAFMWDILVKGATQEECEKIAAKIGVPRPGSARVHNENIEYKAVAPDLKAHDASYDGKLLKTFCLGSQGFPEHFFGEGGDVNKATAVEMHEPVVKMLTSRQRFICGMWTKIHDFAIDKGVAYRSLSPNVNRKYEIYFPELSASDMQKAGLTMLYLAQSLAMAVKNGWISGEKAAKVYTGVASTFGPNIEPEEKVVIKPDVEINKKVEKPPQTGVVK
jgi:hypothetical protein